jgi:hypothetical protein
MCIKSENARNAHKNMRFLRVGKKWADTNVCVVMQLRIVVNIDDYDRFLKKGAILICSPSSQSIL